MKEFLKLPAPLRGYISAVILAGTGLGIALAPGVYSPEIQARLLLFLPVLLVWTVVCSLLRIDLSIPGGTMTLGTAAVSLAQIILGTREAMLVAAVGTSVSYYASRPRAPETGKPRPIKVYQVFFNICNALVASAVGGLVYDWVKSQMDGLVGEQAIVPAILAWVTCYFLLNTIGVALAIALRTEQSVTTVWRENFFWTAPGYLACASLAVGTLYTFNQIGLWSLLFIPPIFLVYRSYRLHIDRLKAARQYEQLIENARDGIIILREMKLVYANESFARILGMSRGNMEGRDFETLLAESQAPAGCLRDGGDGALAEQRLRRSDGMPVEVEITASSVVYHGQPSIQALVRDVSQRYSMQRQAAQTEKLRALGQMASGVAHDFNNSLMAILGNITLARVALPLECAASHLHADERLQAAEQSATDASATVRRLQAFGRPAASHLEAVNLQELVREVVLITRPVWRDAPRASGREITVEIAGDSESYVRGSAAELREAITNLIYNAVHAMPAGGLLRFYTSSDEQDATLSISDTGTGMTRDVLDRLFEPFYTTKGAAGSGLGLFVTYGIVSQHGGRVEVRSAPGAGTTFTLSFPATARQMVAAPEPELRPKPGTRVLVVDDEEVVRDVVGSMLTSVGAIVRQVKDASTALSLLREEPFDVVITDLSMPDMSGLDLAREVRALHPRMPLLLLTGWAEGSEAVDTGPDLVTAILTKPVPMRVLLQRVAAAVTESSGPAEIAGAGR